MKLNIKTPLLWWLVVWTGVVILVVFFNASQRKVHPPIDVSYSKFAELDLYYHKIPIKEMTLKKLERMYGAPELTLKVAGGRWTEVTYKLEKRSFLTVTVDPSTSKILDYKTLESY